MASVEIIQSPPTATYNGRDPDTGNIALRTIDLAPTDTPLIWGLRSEVLGTFPLSVTTLEIVGPVLAGETIRLYTTTLTAAAIATASAAQFWACNTSTLQRADTARTLAEAINRSPALNVILVAEAINLSVAPAVRITHRVKGLYYNLVTIPALNLDNYATTSAGITNTLDAQSNDENRGMRLEPYQYEVWLSVEVAQGGDGNTLDANWGQLASTTPFKGVATLAQAYNGSNAYRFDLARILRTLLRPSLPDLGTPTAPVSTLQRIGRAILGYRLRYGEAYNGGNNGLYANGLPVDDANNIVNTYLRRYEVGTTEIRYAAPGAFDLGVVPPPFAPYWDQVHANPAIPGDNEFTTIRTLSDAPPLQQVRRTNAPEPVSLYILNDRRGAFPTTLLAVNTTLTYVDGTTQALTATHSTSITQSGLYTLDAQPAVLGVTAAETAANLDALTWEVRVVVLRFDPSNPLLFTIQTLAVRTYAYDTNTDTDRYTTLYWRNRFGVLEAWAFEGFAETELDVDRDDLQASLPRTAGDNRATAYRSDFALQADTETTYVSGYVNAEHYAWLQGLATSPEVYRLTTNASGAWQLQRLQILESEWEQNDADTLYVLTLTVRNSYPINTLRQ